MANDEKRCAWTWPSNPELRCLNKATIEHPHGNVCNGSPHKFKDAEGNTYSLNAG